MFDATKLLGALLEQRSAPPAGDRPGNAPGQGGFGAGGSPLEQLLSRIGGAGAAASPAGGFGGAGGNPLGQLLSQLGGGTAGSSSGAGSGLAGLLGALTGAAASGGVRPGAPGLLDGLAEMARQAAAQPKQEIERNTPVAIGGLGALAGTLLGGGRGAVGGGLLAVLGSLAYAALEAGQQGGGGAASQTATSASGAAAAAAPGTPEEVQRAATLVLRAMIQAAKADGQLDAREIERITAKLREAGEEHEARDFVLGEMSGPVDVERLAREARTPKEAAEVYAASLMAIEVDTEAERDYLVRLASALNLSQPTVAYLHHSFGVPAA